LSAVKGFRSENKKKMSFKLIKKIIQNDSVDEKRR
jgi:hypothetical protein